MAEPIFGTGLNPEPVVNVTDGGDVQFDNRGNVIQPKPVHIVNLSIAGNAAVAALTPLANGADLPTTVAKVNQIIAALKA